MVQASLAQQPGSPRATQTQLCVAFCPCPTATLGLLCSFLGNRHVLNERKTISGSGASGKQAKIKERKMITLSKQQKQLPTVIVNIEEFSL